MNTHADKTQGTKNQSVASTYSQIKNSSDTSSHFVDNRPEATLQRKLQEMANNGPQGNQSAPLQVKADNYSSQQTTIQKKENNTGLPDHLKSGIEHLSGYAMDDVKVHRNSNKPAQLQAHAYAQGTDIHLGPGQEKHLPHEAWHVVQQKQGRVKPTLQMKGSINVNDDKGLEREADVMGAIAKTYRSKNTEATLSRENASSQNSLFQFVDYPKDSPGTINEDIPNVSEEWNEVNSIKLQNLVIDITRKAAETERNTGFRIGTYAMTEDGNLQRIKDPFEEVHGMDPLPEGFEYVDEFAIPLTIKTMMQAGQWQYIAERWEEINETHIVVVDVDCQFDRMQGRVGYHKDSRGTTTFVNLTYSNEEAIIGPEFYEDRKGDPGLERLLPNIVQKDIAIRREGAEDDEGSKYNKLDPFARFSFSDPNLYHSTPLLGSRKEMEKYDDVKNKFFKKTILEELNKDKYPKSLRNSLQEKKGFRETRAWKRNLEESIKNHPSKKSHEHGFEENSELPTNEKLELIEKAKTRPRSLSQDLSEQKLHRAELKEMAAKPRTFVRSWVRMIPRDQIK